MNGSNDFNNNNEPGDLFEQAYTGNYRLDDQDMYTDGLRLYVQDHLESVTSNCK